VVRVVGNRQQQHAGVCLRREDDGGVNGDFGVGSAVERHDKFFEHTVTMRPSSVAS
jgi:hypothetical protein